MGIDTVSMLATDQDRAEAFYQNLLAAAFDAVRLIRFLVKQGKYREFSRIWPFSPRLGLIQLAISKC